MTAITDSTRKLLSQALTVAASRYVELAFDAYTMQGGAKLGDQYNMQAIETRKFAILLGDSKAIAISGIGDESAAHEEARKITARHIIDERRHRESAVSAGGHVCGPGCELDGCGFDDNDGLPDNGRYFAQ